MKRYISVVLALVMLLAAAGCGKEKAPQPQKVEFQPQKVEFQAQGIWHAEDGTYLAVLPNGFAMSFDLETMKQGQWSEENECVTAVFEDGVVRNEYAAQESTVVYEHDGQGRLQAEGKTYSSVTEPDAYRVAASQIDAYQMVGGLSWSSQVQMNMGYGVTYQLWDGLEQLIFAQVMETVEEPDVWQEDEQNWQKLREEAMKAARAEFEGGSAASMVAYSSGIGLTVDRVQSMLNML